MKIFAALKKLREFEGIHLPFLKTLIDFDIIIEIGYAQEQGRPLTLKRLYLVGISSRATICRRLGRLEEQGVVIRETKENDRRSSSLTISSASHKAIVKYVRSFISISSLFKLER